MKAKFFDLIIELMKKNKNIYFISVGLGWPRTDELSTLYPQQFIQTEASEQTALDIAVGLAYSGKTPFVYTITPFFWRGAETLRTYISHEYLNVKLIGAGRNDDYSKDDGFSHDAKDIGKLMDMLNIEQLMPQNNEDLESMVDWMVKSKNPQFLSLRR